MKTTTQEIQMATRSPAEQAARFSFANKITDITMAARFIDSLADAKLMFHLEDHPAEVIDSATGKYLFSAHEAVLLRKRVKELYSFNWSRYNTKCPISYFLTYCQN